MLNRKFAIVLIGFFPLFFPLLFPSMVLATTLIWQLPAKQIDNKPARITLEVSSNILDREYLTEGEVHLRGSIGQNLTACSIIDESSGLIPIQEASQTLPQYFFWKNHAILHSHDWRKCRESRKQRFFYDYVLSDQPLFIELKLKERQPSQHKSENQFPSLIQGNPPGQNKPESILTGDSYYPGNDPDDRFNKKRPWGSFMPGAEGVITLLPSILLPVHRWTWGGAEEADHSLLTLIINTPESGPEFLPVPRDQLLELLNNMTSVHSLIQWLIPRFNGRHHMINRLMAFQEILTHEEMPVNPDLLEAVTQQMVTLLELPDPYFSLTIEQDRLIESCLDNPNDKIRSCPEGTKTTRKRSHDDYQASSTSDTLNQSDNTDTDAIAPPDPKRMSKSPPPGPEGETKPDPQLILSGTLRQHDTCYVESSDDLKKVLGLLREQNPSAYLVLLSDPSNVYDDDLLGRTYIKSDGEEEHTGRLYGEEPVVLVVDARKMSPGRLAELNELYDLEPRIHSEYLGKQVKVVTLVSQKMIPKSEGSLSSKPAADFFGRVSHARNQWDLASTNGQDNQRLQTFIDSHLGLEEDGESLLLQPNTIVLNFIEMGEWRKTLFGSPVIDSSGTVIYKHSLLFGAEGKNVVLLGAPWEDANFRLRMAKLLESGYLEANGESCSLKGTRFYTTTILPEDIARQLKKSVSYRSQPTASMVSINNENLDGWLNNVAFDASGKVITHDELAIRLKRGDGIRISSGLSFSQWYRLLKKIDELQQDSVDFYIDSPGRQPELFRPVQIIEGMDVDPPEPIVTLIEGDGNTPDLPGAGYFELNLTQDTQLSSLFGRIDIISTKRREFSITELELMTALKSGTPLFIWGLEQNTKLQYQLESLLEASPGLLINGRWEPLDGLEIVVYLPKGSELSSPVWKALAKKTIESVFTKNYGALSAANITDQSDGEFYKEFYGVFSNNIEHLLERIRNLGVSARKHWPDHPPRLSGSLLSKLQRQLTLERKSMPGDTKEQYWQRAINTVILEEYRSNREVHAWLAFIVQKEFLTLDDGSWLWLDIQGIKNLMSESVQINRRWLERNFWQLSRFIGPELTADWQHASKEPNEKQLGELADILIQIEPDKAQILTLELPVKKNFNISSIPSRNTGLEHRIRKLCIKYKRQCGTSTKEIRELATTFDNKGQDEIQSLLKEKSGIELPVAVIEQLLKGKSNWEQWRHERSDELTTLIKQHPVVFLKGEPGSGKSFTAERTASQLNPQRPPVVFTAGPEMDEDNLFEKQVMMPLVHPVSAAQLSGQGFSAEAVQYIMETTRDASLSLTEGVVEKLQKSLSQEDYQKLKRLYGDRHTQWEKGPVQHWVDTRSENGELIFLIIDEVNLLKTGTLNALFGLFTNRKSIGSTTEGEAGIPVHHGGHYSGNLSRYHRLILTGNPEFVGGRVVDELIREGALTVYYSPLEETFLLNGLFRARVNTFLALSAEQKESVLTVSTRLWQQYRHLLTNHEFTARDLHDIADRIEFFLSFCPPEVISRAGSKQIAGLVWYAFKGSLGGEVSPSKQPKLEALKDWYEFSFGLESELLESAWEAFNVFYQKLQADSPDFYFKSSSVRELAYVLWQQVLRVNWEKGAGTSFSGKHATLIEGPAGRGKDQLLLRILRLLASNENETGGLNSPLIAKAGLSSRQSLKEKLTQAQGQGKIIVVPEINIMESQYLEGEVNDLLTGAAEPGFHLFATINPVNFSGRKPLSSALASRFTTFRIDKYNEQELEEIIRLFMGNYPEQARQLAVWHGQLIKELIHREQFLLPTSRELRNLAQLIGDQAMSGSAMQNLFAAHYRLYTDHLKDFDLTSCLNDMDEAMDINANRVVSSEMLRDIYQSLPDFPPVVFRKGIIDSYDSKAGILELKEGSSDACDQKRRITRLYLMDKWTSQGLTEEMPDNGGVLLSALYHYWQHEFFRQLLDKSEVNTLVPLSREEQRTLQLIENEPYAVRANSLLEARQYVPDPVLYFDLKRLLLTPVKKLKPEEKANTIESRMTETRAMLKKLSIEDATFSKIKTLEPESIPLLSKISANPDDKKVSKIFKDYGLNEQRLKVTRLSLCGNKIHMVSDDYGSNGYDWVEYESFSARGHLQACETMGQTEALVAPGVWTPLPGLKDIPGARLKALGVELIDSDDQLEGIEVVRDRANDQFLYRFSTISESTISESTISESTISESTISESTISESTISEDEELNVIVTFVLELDRPKSTPNCSSFLSSHIPVDADPKLRNALDSNSAVEQILDELKNETNIKTQLRKLQYYVGTFRYQGAIIGRGVEKLQNIFIQKPAPSYYRTLVFWSIATHLGIPCRIVAGQTMSRWLECSYDAGFTWEVFETYGTEPLGGELSEADTAMPELEKDELPDEMDLRFKLTEYSPEKLINLVKTALPGSKAFDYMYHDLPEAIAQCISEDGPLTLEVLKERLAFYHTRGVLTHKLMSTLLKALSDKDAASKTKFYAPVWRFLVEQKWLRKDVYPDGIHTQSEDINDVTASDPLQQGYYEEALTTLLEEGRDIHVSVEDKWLKPSSKELDDIVTQNSMTEISPILVDALYGESPQDSYSETSPGVLNIPRLVRHYPAFRRSALKPAIRPALLPVSLMISWDDVDKFLTEKLSGMLKQSEAKKSKHRTAMTKSSILVSLLNRYLVRGFFSYLYRHSGGEDSKLRLLFPRAPEPSISMGDSSQAAEEWTKDPRERANHALKPGYFAPASREGFLAMMMKGDDRYNEDLLSEVWLRKGFAEPNLSLLREDVLIQLLNQYANSFNYQKLFAETLKTSAFQEKLEERKKYVMDRYSSSFESYSEEDRQKYNIVPVGEFEPIIDDIIWANE